MSTSILFNERIRTRIVQAIGRCTRNTVDYSVVCIIGDTLINELVSPKKLIQYHPELQAEIDFGYDQSSKVDNSDDLIKMIEIFLNRDEQWDEVEKELVSIRDEKIDLLDRNELKEDFGKLLNSAFHEVNFQYAIWKEDYEHALKCINNIINILDSPKLRGYKGYWYYVGACVAHSSYLNGNKSYSTISNQYLNNAASCSSSITWFRKLKNDSEEIKIKENTLFDDIVERLEISFIKDGIRSSRKFENKAKEILELLSDASGKHFERGYEKLGELLGYHVNNPKGDGSPDPYWIVNENLCIVSENKIYETDNKYIPLVDIRQALTHESWIREYVDILSKNVQIITVFITNTTLIEESGRVHAKDLYYVNRSEIVEWARIAIDSIRSIRTSFSDAGDLVWREKAKHKLEESRTRPEDFISLIKKQKLSELQSN